MGDVRINVRIQAVLKSGTLSAKGFREVEALVDTGASKTIVSERLAGLIGIRTLAVTGGVSGIGGVIDVPVGVALLHARGVTCDPEPLLVGISDRIAHEAGAEIILGHDYMQPRRMVVRPYARSAACEPRPNPRARSAPRATKTRR